MKRWVSIVAVVPLLTAVVLGVGQAGAASGSRPMPTTVSPGYWLVTAAGATYAFNAPDLAQSSHENISTSDCGNGPGPPVPEAITCTGISATADGQGYWVGESAYFVLNGVGQYAVEGIPQGVVGGNCIGPVSAGLYLPTPTVGIAAAPVGVWLATADGGVFAGCGATFYGSMGGTRLNQTIVGLAATPDWGGYWEVAGDGGIFAFGDAGFYGSMAAVPLNKPIVGIVATQGGKGYWLVASDGGVFSFGDAQFAGSMGGKRLNAPMTGIARNPTGTGYWTVAADGGVFAFGGAPFLGSEGGQPLDAAVVGIASRG
jgi:hypothetical protein